MCACVSFVSLGFASELKFKSQNNQASVDFKMCPFLIAENTNVFFLFFNLQAVLKIADKQTKG